MINLNKSLEFFDPSSIDASVHIIGVGALGSHIALTLARLGVTDLHIYDFDMVEMVNIANQVYTFSDVGQLKIDALENKLKDINPSIKVKKIMKYTGQTLSGHVFLAVDSITVRQDCVRLNMMNPNIKAMYDVRMRLTDAQHYAADWSNIDHKKNLFASMDFTEEEAKASTPVSACGTTLSVIPTVQFVSLVAVTNFMNFIQGQPIKRTILIDSFHYMLDAFN